MQTTWICCRLFSVSTVQYNALRFKHEWAAFYFFWLYLSSSLLNVQTSLMGWSIFSPTSAHLILGHCFFNGCQSGFSIPLPNRKKLFFFFFSFSSISYFSTFEYENKMFFLSWFQLHRCLFLASAFEVAAKVGHPSRKIQFKHSSSMIYSCKYHEFRWVSSDFAYSIVGPPSICSASFGNVVVVHK